VLCDRHQAPRPGEPRRPRGHVLGSLRACTVGRCRLASAREPQQTDPLEFSRLGGNTVTGTAAPHPVRRGTRQPAGGRRPRCYPHDPAHGVQVSHRAGPWEPGLNATLGCSRIEVIIRARPPIQVGTLATASRVNTSMVSEHWYQDVCV